jgi:hypothetical protein
MNLLNHILPWRRRKIEAVTQALIPEPHDLSSQSLEGLLIAISNFTDERGLKIHIRPERVLSKQFINDNFSQMPWGRAWGSKRMLDSLWPKKARSKRIFNW